MNAARVLIFIGGLYVFLALLAAKYFYPSPIVRGRKRLLCSFSMSIAGLIAGMPLALSKDGMLFAPVSFVSGAIVGAAILPPFINNDDKQTDRFALAVLGGAVSGIIAVFIGTFLLGLFFVNGQSNAPELSNFLGNLALVSMAGMVLMSPIVIPAGALGAIVAQRFWEAAK